MNSPYQKYYQKALEEAGKLNDLLEERSEAKKKSDGKNKANEKSKIGKAIRKIKFIWNTAGGGGFFSKVLFFLSPLGLKLVFKFFRKGLLFPFTILFKQKVVETQNNYHNYILRLKANNRAAAENIISQINSLKIKPCFTAVCVVSSENPFLKNTIESILNQYYVNLQLIVVVSEDRYQAEAEVLSLYAKDDRFSFFTHPSTDIGSMASESLQLVKGEFVSVIPSGMVLEQNALFEFAQQVNETIDAGILYSDEDEIETVTYKNPVFKPDWSPDLLLSSFYIGHSTFVKTSLVFEAGGIDGESGTAFLYDLILKISERRCKICHIPKVLFHSNRVSNPEEDFYVHFFCKRAIEKALVRRNVEAEVRTISTGIFNLVYSIKNQAKVSIIIPTKDKSEILDVCLNSIFTLSTYSNYEVIVIDNNSKEKETFELFKNYAGKYPDKFFNYSLPIPFNYSKINNFGAEKARGNYLLFLNNDTEIITPDWIERMVGQAQREEIGAVGVKLLYPDRSVQHAGMVIGLEWGGNTFVGEDEYSGGYQNYILQVRNYSAVTAACLMCRKEVFEKIGGFDEAFAVEFNDSDFCLKIMELGYYNLYVPYVVLLHYESLSRGYVHVSAKSFERHKLEKELFSKKWSKYLYKDPFYNENFSKEKAGFAIKVV